MLQRSLLYTLLLFVLAAAPTACSQDTSQPQPPQPPGGSSQGGAAPHLIVPKLMKQNKASLETLIQTLEAAKDSKDVDKLREAVNSALTTANEMKGRVTQLETIMSKGPGPGAGPGGAGGKGNAPPAPPSNEEQKQ